MNIRQLKRQSMQKAISAYESTGKRPGTLILRRGDHDGNGKIVQQDVLLSWEEYLQWFYCITIDGDIL